MGWQAEIINKRIKGQEDFRGQLPSYPASHGVRSKNRYTEVRERKTPEVKGRQGNSYGKLTVNKPI